MTASVIFTVHGKPQPWRRSRTGSGHHFMDGATRSYQSEIKTEAAKAMLAGGIAAPLLEGPLAMMVVAIFAKPASWSKKRAKAAIWCASAPDVDNICKGIADACNGLVFKDDRQIARLVVDKRYSDDGSARVEVGIIQIVEVANDPVLAGTGRLHHEQSGADGAPAH